MRVRKLGLLAAACCACAIAGCRLPDVTPFASAVSRTALGVQETGDSIAGAAGAFSTSAAERIEREWQVRVALVEALNGYADTLSSVVAAGQSGRTGVQKLGGALDRLLGVFGSASVAGSTAFRVGGEVYALAAEAKAAATVHDAVREAQPVIARACALLIEDLNDAEMALAQLRLTALARERISAESSALRQQIKQLDGVRQIRFAQLDDGQTIDPGELAALDALISTRHDELAARTMPIDRSFRATLELIARTRSAVRALAVEHGRLADAIETKRTAGAGTLEFAAARLLETTATVRAILNETPSGESER